MGLSTARPPDRAAPNPQPWSPTLGVDPKGQPPLPWLAAAWDAALALDHAHALLLHGPEGAGHAALAGLLAQSWLCERTPQAAAGHAAAPGHQHAHRACGACDSCHLVRRRSHPDLLVLLPEALRLHWGWLAEDEGRPAKAEAKPSREIRVQQVREAIAWGQQTSGRGRAKVLVLHPADALNPAAANALLKTLEEPPGRLRLLLTSADPERLLPTVRSRCQRVPLALPAPEAARAWLQAQGLAEPDALLAVCGGSPLQALDWAAEGLDAAWLARLPARVAAGDATPLQGKPVPRVVALLVKLAHDAMVQAVGGAPRYFAPEHLPAGADLAALAAWQRQLLRTARHDEHPWNAGLLVESLVAQAATVWASAPGRRR